MTADKRRYKRFDVTLEVQADMGRETFPGRILRISLGGCFVNTALSLPIGERMDLRLRGADLSALGVSGEVRSVIAGVGLGVKFFDLSDKAQEQIRHIIYKQQFDQKRTAGLTEERKVHRVMLSVPIRITGIDIFDDPFEETTVTENISILGARFRTRHFVGVGTTVEVEALQKFRAKAIVRFLWVSAKSGELFSVGIHFLETEGHWLLK